MKRILMMFMLTATLVGCAASAYKQARASANLVKNGMTLAEVVQVLGMPPSIAKEDYVYWRRGTALEYDGTANGAIRFELANGVVINVPEGGIFNAKTAEEIRKKRDAKRMAEYEEKQALMRSEEAALARAVADSAIVCSDRLTCGKVFALAQIYVREHSDMKIQVATDTIVETFNPTDDGKIGITIIKTPRSGSTEVVSITPNCKDKTGSFEEFCRSKRTTIYKGFRPFIESNLAK
jgi:hypothetical protein